MMKIDFADKRILVTGAGKGIGRDIAVYLTELHATVIAVSRTKDDLVDLKEQINCDIICADLADPAAMADIAREASDVDMLVNNAGVSIPQSFLDTTVEAYNKIMDVNVRAAVFLTQALVPQMVERNGSGAIVNISSKISTRALLDHVAYCASKGAIDQVTRVMALELGPKNIRVNSVNPTVVLTPMGKMAWADPQRREKVLSRIPLGRFAEPRHISHAVAFLLSDYSEMMTGVIMPVDGGYLVH